MLAKKPSIMPSRLVPTTPYKIGESELTNAWIHIDWSGAGGLLKIPKKYGLS
jgi:hypothetical protein